MSGLGKFCGTAWPSANFFCHGRVQSDMVQENIGLELLGGQPLWPSRPNPNAHPAGRAHFISSLPCAGPSRSHQGEGDKSSPPRLHFLVKGEEIYMILTLQIGPLLFPFKLPKRLSHSTQARLTLATLPLPSTHPFVFDVSALPSVSHLHALFTLFPALRIPSPFANLTNSYAVIPDSLLILHTAPSWLFNYQDMGSQGYDRA